MFFCFINSKNVSVLFNPNNFFFNLNAFSILYKGNLSNDRLKAIKITFYLNRLFENNSKKSNIFFFRI